MEVEKLLTVSEAARVVGVTVRQIFRFRVRYKWPSYQLGRERALERSDVMRLAGVRAKRRQLKNQLEAINYAVAGI